MNRSGPGALELEAWITVVLYSLILGPNPWMLVSRLQL